MMGNMPEMTLTEAAQWAGKGRTTIFKALKQGRLSARKDDDGEWLIDPAELARVYPPAKVVNVPANGSGEQQAIGGELEALRRENTLLREVVDDLRSERDKLLGALGTRLIADQRGSWWRRLRGKA
jgi:hypothetical protein